MYAVPTGSILEMQWRATLQSQQCICTFHYKTQDSILDGALALTEFINDFGLIMGTGMAQQTTTDVQGIQWRGQFVYPTRFVHQTVVPAQTAGMKLPPTVSIGTSAVMAKRTELAARNARGRIFFPGFPASYLDIGTLVDPGLTDLRTAIAEQMPVNITAATEGVVAVPVVWSYTAPVRATTITTGTIDRYVRYQRRREVGRGI